MTCSPELSARDTKKTVIENDSIKLTPLLADRIEDTCVEKEHLTGIEEKQVSFVETKVTCYFYCVSSFEKWCDSCREKSSLGCTSITVRELLSDGVTESWWQTQGVAESSWVYICIGDLSSWSSSNKWCGSSGSGNQWSWNGVVGHCGLVRGGGDGWSGDSWSSESWSSESWSSGNILSWGSSYKWCGSSSLSRDNNRLITVHRLIVK